MRSNLVFLLRYAHDMIGMRDRGDGGSNIIGTLSGEKAKVTMAFEPKFVSTARLMPFPLVRSGNISDTISQLIGPNDI